MKHIQHHSSSTSLHHQSLQHVHPLPGSQLRGSACSSSHPCGPGNTGSPHSFHVQSVTVIPAEVTLVKCNLEVPQQSTETMVVDISYSQKGGITAAAFLEEADRYVDAYHAVRSGPYRFLVAFIRLTLTCFVA
jgi:hypothetical protein